MKIPKRIKIGQVTYKILSEDIEGNIQGYHDATKNNREIVLDNKLKGEVLKNVFYHELVHAILWEMGSELTEEELFVQSLANMLQQVNEKINKE